MRVARTGFDIAVGVFEQLEPLGGLEGQERIRKAWESVADLQDVIVIDSNMPTDEIKREVADKLENNEEKYREVLKAKGFPEAQTRRLLALMISCFKNSPQ